ncbi:g12624 [Coccomyxa viridis]|uniref:G12624 protein n=1 Tax=Coccomyxa viridis TaxID=1274662 RepID=A0ABP1GHV0_9CHLO
MPVKNGALAMIAAGREDEADVSKEGSMAGGPGIAPVQLHVDASTTLNARTDRSTEQAEPEAGVPTKHGQPLGLVKAAVVGVSIGVASGMLYLWCMERQRKDNLAWEYYRTH